MNSNVLGNAFFNQPVRLSPSSALAFFHIDNDTSTYIDTGIADQLHQFVETDTPADFMLRHLLPYQATQDGTVRYNERGNLCQLAHSPSNLRYLGVSTPNARRLSATVSSTSTNSILYFITSLRTPPASGFLTSFKETLLASLPVTRIFWSSGGSSSLQLFLHVPL